MEQLAKLIDQLAQLFECIGKTIIALTQFELALKD